MNVPLVIGLGSPHGDDQAGWLVIEALRRLQYPDDRLLSAEHPTRLLDFCNEQRLVICDACAGTSLPGAVHHGFWADQNLPDQRSFGAHGLPLENILQILRQLSDALPVIELWTIAGRSWEPATEPAMAVRAAALQVAETIWLGTDIAH